MALISESFYKSVATIASIFVAGYFVNVSVTNTITSTMETINKPLKEKMESLEKRQDIYEAKQNVIVSDLSVNSYRINASKMALDRALTFFDKKFHMEFIKPDDIYYKTKESEGSNE